MEFDVEIGIGLILGFIVIGSLLTGKLPFASRSKLFKDRDEELRDPNNPLNPHFKSGIDENGRFEE